MSGVLQSGNVTPLHLAAWTTDGVIQDAGVALANTYGMMAYTKQAINFNAANTDYPLLVLLPAGFTRYRIHQILISNASGSLTTATCSAYTGAGATDVNVVASATAITVSTATSDTNNNMQSLTIVNQNTLALVDTVVYFRVQTPQGAAVTGDVTIYYQPMP